MSSGKTVGLVAKAKRRKKVSESRLAQRTGKSTMDRKIESLIKAIKKGDIKPIPMPRIKGEEGKKPVPPISILRKYIQNLKKDGRKPTQKDITNWWKHKINKNIKKIPIVSKAK